MAADRAHVSLDDGHRDLHRAVTGLELLPSISRCAASFGWPAELMPAITRATRTSPISAIVNDAASSRLEAPSRRMNADDAQMRVSTKPARTIRTRLMGPPVGCIYTEEHQACHDRPRPLC